MLTLVAALSTARAIEETAGLEAKIKWPNDLVVNKKKVTGILTELSAEMEQIHYIVIGIGINVNTENMPAERYGRQSKYSARCNGTVERRIRLKSSRSFVAYYFLKN